MLQIRSRALGLLNCQFGQLNKVLKSRLSTTGCVCGRKSRDPYDKRFTTTLLPSELGEKVKGGTKALRKMVEKRDYMPQKTGFYDKQGKFHFVPEMVPEFVVPDLSDFKLKPYVSYRVPEITQSEFTSRDLFNAVYAKPVIKEYKAETLKEEDMEVDKLLAKTKSPS